MGAADSRFSSADDSLDLKPPEQTKVMRWPMAVPAMKEAAPPKPSNQVEDVARLERDKASLERQQGVKDDSSSESLQRELGRLQELLDTSVSKSKEEAQVYQKRILELEQLAGQAATTLPPDERSTQLREATRQIGQLSEKLDALALSGVADAERDAARARKKRIVAILETELLPNARRLAAECERV